MNEIKITVGSMDQFFGDALEMARRLDRGERAVMPAVLQLENAEMLFRLLTPNRWVLLRRLKTRGPLSIRALSKDLGRDYRGVHSDVMALIDADLIERSEDGKILVPWSRITAEMALDVAA